MSDLAEVQIALIPLVKRDHPRWSTNRCKLEAGKLAKKFMAENRTLADWSRVQPVKQEWDITSKLVREF